MLSGSAAFPGVKDACDQIDKIWRVLGTPSDKLALATASIFKNGESAPVNLSELVFDPLSLPEQESCNHISRRGWGRHFPSYQ